ncbi:alpha/beta hydrolase [Bradyrhizobium sp. CB3481]|uniref:alpha/beta hydrolase family protein n=1 Tax=Bradyrhizobium sp. CB3481 TaxID=3039158 RepID=UPI0024B1017C|nr:alpha/beta hydrolase [Bradyrhizobium sp. CB3481]WFU19706.1 alpha/beta hydrolase [Bradyrhizobium sp. CB3481]
MVAECLLVAGRLDPADYADSWHREWTGIADRSRERADAAFARGHVPTAQGNWLRAINYYQASMFALDDGEKRKAALEAMRACARRHIAHLAPAGEVVEIPWQERRALEGYFLPASSSGRTPVIVCMGDPGHYKEEYLFKVARHARERGLSLLAVDLLGSATDSEFGEMIGRPGLETSVSSVVDYLTTRDDVDERRIAVLGDGAGSSFVARGVALESRFAAVVCDGGIWDMHEHAFLMNRLSPAGTEGGGFERRWPVRRFHCPVLVTMGGQGWLESGMVADLFERLRARHPGISLKIFESSETAAAQGHCDNPTLANEFIFDWLADRLEAVPA